MIATTPTLQGLAAYLRQHHLRELAEENLRVIAELDAPLLSAFAHLPPEELLTLATAGLAQFLGDLETGRALETAAEALSKWAAGQLEGISTESVTPRDMVLVSAAQKQAILRMVERYAEDVPTAMAIALELEAFYTATQTEAFQVFTRLREEGAQRLARAEAERLRADKEAERLQALNAELAAQAEELHQQAEELQANQEELAELYDKLRARNEVVEAEVAMRTRRLREREAMLANAQVLGNCGSWEWHLPTGALSWSDHLYRIYGLEPGEGELSVENFLGRLHPEDRDRVFTTIQDALRTGEPFAFTERILRPDGSVRILESSGEVLTGESGEPETVRGVCQDVTERRLLGEQLQTAYHDLQAANEELMAQAEELQSANEEFQSLDRYKDEFLSVISHELRTPLNFITGFASTLQDEVQGPLSERQHEAIAKILNGADRMLLLVNDLLDFAKIQSGRFDLFAEPTHYPSLVNEVIGLLKPLADQKALTLATDVRIDKLARLDGSRVSQVLTNLITNAIKFTDAGGTVRVHATIRDGQLLTEVIDTGWGIAPEHLPRLFKHFQQLDMSNSRKASGTGLGLAISKAIVEAHEGRIGVTSKPGEGSTFWFTLPL